MLFSTIFAFKVKIFSKTLSIAIKRSNLAVYIFKCFISEGFGPTQWFPGQKRDVLINFIHSTKFGYFTLKYRCVSALLRVYIFKCFISEGFGPKQWFPGVLKKNHVVPEENVKMVI